MLSLDKQAIEPHAELVKEAHDGGKTIAMDFDGVINSYKSGWKGPTETDEPVLSAAESISSLFNRGYRLIIFSTRAQTPEGVETIREYLRKHTENDLLVNSIEITDRKPIADVYIDDRAIPFTGNWEETLEKIETFEPWVSKSLTYSGYPLQGRKKVGGMDISIENKKGSIRSGTDKDGHEWHTKMGYDYGYIRGTVGKDKDHVDCFLGPNPESEKVFVIHQVDPYNGGAFDEDKVMLGWDSAEEAKKAYLSQYDRPDFYGSMDVMDIETFKEKAFDPKNKGKMLKKALFTGEDMRKNARFLQAIYDIFKDEEKTGKIDFFGNRYKMQDLEGFPKGLDLENCELLAPESDKIWVTAGGDWQQSINFAVELKDGKLKITHVFDGNAPKQDREMIKNLEETIEAIAERN
jgi:hypothetical protein